MSYAGNGTIVSVPPAGRPAGRPANKGQSNGTPDFATMTAAEKVAYQRARWDRILGGNGR
jgi:hypothetical protein